MENTKRKTTRQGTVICAKLVESVEMVVHAGAFQWIPSCSAILLDQIALSFRVLARVRLPKCLTGHGNFKGRPLHCIGMTERERK